MPAIRKARLNTKNSIKVSLWTFNWIYSFQLNQLAKNCLIQSGDMCRPHSYIFDHRWVRSRYPKVSYFFFTCKSSFFTHFWTKSIEWMKMLCFFFRRRKKKTQIWNRMNEWHVNFYRKKKTHKNTTKSGKKKTQRTFL